MRDDSSERIFTTAMINLRSTVHLSLVGAFAILLADCATPPVVEAQPVTAPVAGSNSLTSAERAAGWRLLFDGTNLDSWRGYKKPSVPEGWRVVDGTIAKDKPVEDIVSEGGVRRLRARDRMEDRRGGQQRHLLSRHRGVRSHLLDRARVPAARRHQGRRQQDAPHVRRRGVWFVSVTAGTPQAGGRVERDSHHRSWCACGTLAERLQAARVRALEPGLGGQGRGEQVPRMGEVRPAQARTSRNARRSQRDAGVPVDQDSRAELGPFFLEERTILSAQFLI